MITEREIDEEIKRWQEAFGQQSTLDRLVARRRIESRRFIKEKLNGRR